MDSSHQRNQLVDVGNDHEIESSSRSNSSNMGSQEAIIDAIPSSPPPPPPAQQANGSNPTNQDQQTTYKLSKQRWLVLFAMTLYGLVSSATGEFNAILGIMLKLLNLSLDNYIYIGQLFMYFSAIGAVPTAWFIDRYGFRVVMYVATVFMLIRSAFRALMFYPDFPNWEHLRLTYWILSGLAASISAVIFFCTPLKISENWFPKSERSIAWTVMISSYSIGSTLAALYYPRIIHEVNDVKPLAYLNIISGAVVSIVIVLCVTRSKPKYPPSERSSKSTAESLPWLNSIKKMCKHPDIILHMLHGVIFDSMNLAVFAVIQDILVSTGHSEIFVGNLIAINSLLSVVVLVALAAFVHRISDILTACKVASVIRTIIFIVHLLTMLYPTAEWIILVVSMVHTVCKCWALPNMNNMTAHIISGTVSEATISGMSTLLYVIFISAGQVAFVKLIRDHANGKHDYTYAIAMASIVSALASLVYMIFFKGKQAKIDPVGGEPESVTVNPNSTNSHDNQAFQRHDE